LNLRYFHKRCGDFRIASWFNNEVGMRRLGILSATILCLTFPGTAHAEIETLEQA